MNDHRALRNGRSFVLSAHGVTTNLDWTDDGTTCPPGWICMAMSEVKNSQCPKDAIVALPITEIELQPGTVTDHRAGLLLCGGHFAVHRRGKDLRLAATL